MHNTSFAFDDDIPNNFDGNKFEFSDNDDNNNFGNAFPSQNFSSPRQNSNQRTKMLGGFDAIPMQQSSGISQVKFGNRNSNLDDDLFNDDIFTRHNTSKPIRMSNSVTITKNRGFNSIPMAESVAFGEIPEKNAPIRRGNRNSLLGDINTSQSNISMLSNASSKHLLDGGLLKSFNTNSTPNLNEQNSFTPNKGQNMFDGIANEEEEMFYDENNQEEAQGMMDFKQVTSEEMPMSSSIENIPMQQNSVVNSTNDNFRSFSIEDFPKRSISANQDFEQQQNEMFNDNDEFEEDFYSPPASPIRPSSINRKNSQISQNSQNFNQVSQNSRNFNQFSQNSQNFNQNSQNSQNFNQVSQNSQNFNQYSQNSQNFNQISQDSQNFNQVSQNSQNFNQYSQNMPQFDDIVSEEQDNFEIFSPRQEEIGNSQQMSYQKKKSPPKKSYQLPIEIGFESALDRSIGNLKRTFTNEFSSVFRQRDSLSSVLDVDNFIDQLSSDVSSIIEEPVKPVDINTQSISRRINSTIDEHTKPVTCNLAEVDSRNTFAADHHITELKQLHDEIDNIRKVLKASSDNILRELDREKQTSSQKRDNELSKQMSINQRMRKLKLKRIELESSAKNQKIEKDGLARSSKNLETKKKRWEEITLPKLMNEKSEMMEKIVKEIGLIKDDINNDSIGGLYNVINEGIDLIKYEGEVMQSDIMDIGMPSRFVSYRPTLSSVSRSPKKLKRSVILDQTQQKLSHIKKQRSNSTKEISDL